MIEVHENLFVGNESDCADRLNGFAVVHACKHPCHARAVGYQGNLASTHPHYLFYSKDNNLYLNMIDPPKPLFKIELFHKYMEFVNMKWDDGKNILIHCNQGESRAPSLALLFLAKSLRAISNASYAEARQDFTTFYPAYYPGKGIQIFLEQNWDSIV
ncbi:MAG: dual specificity protein phosphatase family protein [Candidatus Marinimicrobia bacterium]|nr:dual specificity protein phosphatase family protein [Candidatus Neomarinimicrobiota bacterium]